MAAAAGNLQRIAQKCDKMLRLHLPIRPGSLDDGLLKMPTVFSISQRACSSRFSLRSLRSSASGLSRRGEGRHPEMGCGLLERLAGARHEGDHLAIILFGVGWFGLWRGRGFLFGFAALPFHQTGAT